MSELTYERLHEVLDYNEETGIFIWKIKPAHRVDIGDTAGCKNSKGYIYISIDGKDYRANRLAWFYVYGYFPERCIDHKNRIRHNDWIDNLREVSPQCNARNSGNPKDNTSGVKGVYWNKQFKKWRAMITVNQKICCLGCHKDFSEAVCYRLAGEQCLNWSNCDSSSPAYQYVHKMLKGSKTIKNQSCENCKFRVGTRCDKNESYISLNEWCSAYSKNKKEK